MTPDLYLTHIIGKGSQADEHVHEFYGHAI